MLGHLEGLHGSKHDCLLIAEAGWCGVKIRDVPEVRKGTSLEEVLAILPEVGEVYFPDFPGDLVDFGDGHSSIGTYGDCVFQQCYLTYDPKRAESLRKTRVAAKRRRVLSEGMKHADLGWIFESVWRILRGHPLMAGFMREKTGSLGTDGQAAATIRYLLLIRRITGSYAILDDVGDKTITGDNQAGLWVALKNNKELLQATALYAKGKNTQWLGCFLWMLWVRKHGVEKLVVKPETHVEMLKRLAAEAMEAARREAAKEAA